MAGIKEGSYKKFADIRKFILEPSTREINEKTNVKLEYEVIRDKLRVM